jgi:hypothetical protein
LCVVLVLLGMTALVCYVLEDGGGAAPRCNSPEWTNVDGYR